MANVTPWNDNERVFLLNSRLVTLRINDAKPE